MSQFNLHKSLTPNLSELIARYINRDESLNNFYAFYPDVDGLKRASTERKNFPIDRNLITSVLSKQAQASEYSSEKTISQIKRLEHEDVFTVTTGHQCCLLGGPMYFLYKIISVIRLAEVAEKNGINAVPVFWMATEDHDFEEINHFHLSDSAFEWNTNKNGSVGRFTLEEIEFFESLKGEFKYQNEKLDLIRELETIYSGTKTLSEATRDLVYWLFADYGVVVLDADDANLKGAFRASVDSELTSMISLAPVAKTSEELKAMHLNVQVNPRDINLFWLDEGVRSRIERTESGFRTADDSRNWTIQEMKGLVQSSPECFSPNVILRPVYQEQILPNLAYVGGPGELSYALQLKTMFAAHKTFFPMLVLRDMGLIIKDSTANRLDRLGVNIEDFKKDFHDLEAQITRKHGTHENLVDDPERKIEELLDKIQGDLQAFDQTLGQSAETEKKRIIKRLEVLKKKVLKADKRLHHDDLDRLRSVADEIFPGGVPQERKINWLSFVSSKNQLIRDLHSVFNHLEAKMKVFIQKE